MGVILQQCYADLCDPNAAGTTTGFALIVLRSQHEVATVCDTTTGRVYPVADGAALVHRANIDPVTGCWTSCELPCNSDIAPAGTYYEVVEYLNGVACEDVPEIVQFNCETQTYPNPTSLKDVAQTNPGGVATNLLCPLVEDCIINQGLLALNITDGAGINTTLTGSGTSSSPWELFIESDSGFLDIQDSQDIDLGLSGDGSQANPWMITAQSIIWSAAGDNVLQSTVNGLYVPSMGNLTAKDTNTIDHTLNGDGSSANPFCLESDVLLSSMAGNSITEQIDGLFAAEFVIDFVDGDGIDFSESGSGVVGDPLIITAEPIVAPGDNILQLGPNGLLVPSYNLTATDSTNVGHTLTGDGSQANPWDITSVVKIDGRSDNLLRDDGNGLYVQDCCNHVDLDTASVDYVLTGAGTTIDPFVHSANVKLSNVAGNLTTINVDGVATVIHTDNGIMGTGELGSPISIDIDDQANNAFTVGPNGVYVAANSVIEGDTESIDTTITGTGTVTDPWVISSEVRFDPDSTAPISVGPDGIKIDCCDQGAVDIQDSNSIDFSITGTGTAADPHTITGDLIIDPAGTADVTITGDGLLINTTLVQVQNTGSVDMSIGGDGSVGAPYIIESEVIASSLPNNTVTVEGDGIFVERTALQAIDGCGIDLNLTGAGTQLSPWVLQGDLLIDPAGTATVSCSPTGLRVDMASQTSGLVVTSGDGITHTLSGGGTDVDPWIINLNVDLESTGGLGVGPSGIVIDVDPASTATISTGVDGLRVDETPLQVTTNGNTTGVALSGTNNHVLDITLLSADPGQIASLGSDGGIYIDCAAIEACISADIFLSGSTFDDATNILTLTLNDGNSYPVNLTDLMDVYSTTTGGTSTVDMTITGAGTAGDPWVISGVVITDPASAISTNADGVTFLIDPASTAPISQSGTGIRVDETPNVVTVNGSNIPVSQSGVAGHTIDITTLSGDANNALSTGSDGGLFINTSAFDLGVTQVQDTSSVDMSIAGSGTSGDPYIISSTVIADTDADNTLEVTAAGVKAVSYERMDWSAETYCVGTTIPSAPVFAPGFITDAAITADTAPAGGPEQWELRVNGAIVSTGVLPAGATLAFFPAADFPIAVSNSDVVVAVPVGAEPPTVSLSPTVTARLTGGH